MLRNANCNIVDEHSAVPVLHTRKHSTPLKKSTQAVTNNVDGAHLHCRKMECKLYKSIQHLEFTIYELHYVIGLVVSKLAKTLFFSQCIKDITVSHTNDKERFDDDQSRKNSDDLSTKEILEFHINSQWRLWNVQIRVFKCNASLMSNQVTSRSKWKRKGSKKPAVTSFCSTSA